MHRCGWLAPGLLALLFGLGAALSGCGSGAQPGVVQQDGATGKGSPSAAGMPVGIVTDTAGIGDQSFNMMAWTGVQRAQQELGVVPTKIEAQQAGDYAGDLERLAEKGCKLVIAVGYDQRPGMEEAAEKYPNTQFAIIDSDAPPLPNATGIVFHEEEGSFLAGALAAGMTHSKKLGFVGGQEIPLIKKFEAGYRAGARTINPAVQVEAKYTNNWEDVAKGKELALSLYGEGADIVFHASGRCGLGVIEAAKQQGPGFWAIGVDADQDGLGTADPDHPRSPSRVLTSMVKRVDNAVFAVCKEAHDGTLHGGLRVLGIKENGLGLSPMRYTRQDMPPPLLKKVEELRKRIAAGEIHPPATMEELAGWQAPSR